MSVKLPKFIRYFHNLARKGHADREGDRLVMFKIFADDAAVDPKELEDATQVWLIYSTPDHEELPHE